MLRLIPPALPKPPTWYPGHMHKFMKNLTPTLWQTDIVLEVRDARLPLTSINANFEGVLKTWQKRRAERGLLAERFVIYNKRDLVPKWGINPFKAAMLSHFPGQKVLFASVREPEDRKTITRMIVDAVRLYPMREEINVLVMGMPNVGKSTLLNSLRSAGLGGAKKALLTSADPGLTKALSNRLKIHEHPNIYAYDSPGVMLPHLGGGGLGAERGLKLSLIAGIKPKHYDSETQCSYLLYRMNVQNPDNPFYLQFLEPGAQPTDDVEVFLEAYGLKYQLMKKGGMPDMRRAAGRFVQWWRSKGHIEPLVPPKPNTPGDQLLNLLAAKTRGGVAEELAGSMLIRPPPSSSPLADPISGSNEDLEVMPTPATSNRRVSWGYDFEFEIDEPLTTRKDQDIFLRRKMEALMVEYDKLLAVEASMREEEFQKKDKKEREKGKPMTAKRFANSKVGKAIERGKKKREAKVARLKTGGKRV